MFLIARLESSDRLSVSLVDSADFIPIVALHYAPRSIGWTGGQGSSALST